MYKNLLFMLLFMICFSANVFAESWQHLPDGICAKYAAQEFEKNAPAPGVNWLSDNYDWLSHAHESGWVVKTTVRDVMVGAIVEWQGLERDGGHVAIVRKVLADRIIVEENNVGKTTGSIQYEFGGKRYLSEVTEGWSKATIRSIKYDDMLKMDTRKFMGYIWPVRQSDYDQDPSKYEVSSVDQLKIKEPSYKGFNEYWGPAFMLKEFDKIAPSPGANWRGHVNTWITNAKIAGWVTKTSPDEAAVGALIIRSNPTNNLVKVGIIREIQNNAIRIDARKSNLYPYTETLAIDELKKADKDGYSFIGYILPTRL